MTDRHSNQLSYSPCYVLSTQAGDRTRTGDLLHGKQTLYQLSYARVFPLYAPTGNRTPVSTLKEWRPDR